MTKKLLLVDASSYLYRAFYAMPDMRVVAGDATSAPTGALHGMINMLDRVRKEEPSTYAVCVFDASGPTFRDEWYEEYKANRAPMPDELRAQIEPIHEAIRLMGWPLLQVSGVEADDVIGTLAKIGAEAGMEVVVSTSDKDMAQLVNDKVRLVDTMSNENLDREGVIAKYGVPPERIIDYLTLMGDTSDNVPGVERVGPKTAIKWIAEYGSLEGVIQAAPNMKGVVGEKLRDALDWLPMGKRLVTIVTDCDLTKEVKGYPALDALKLEEIDKKALRDFLHTYGFRKKVQDLDKELAQENATGDLFGSENVAESVVETLPSQEVSYETVLTWAQFDACLKEIQAAKLVAFDLETTSLEPMEAQIVGISFSTQPFTGWYIPLGHNYTGVPQQLPFDEVLTKLKPWFEDEGQKKLGQNSKYDWHVLMNHGITTQGIVHDTMLQSYVLEAHRAHGLENMALRHLNRVGKSYEELCGKGAQQIPFSQLDIENASFYGSEDSDLTLHLHQTLYPQIQSAPEETIEKIGQRGLQRIYALEIASSAALAQIERHGVLIDVKELTLQSHELGKRMATLEQEAYELAGGKFNLRSPKQIGEVFFERLGLPIVKKTSTGAPSTDESVLEKLALNYPLPAKILEHRGLSKLKSTYTDKLPQMVNAQTGRVHTNYAQAVAVTGRLASNDPNLQNIPIRTEEGRRVRKAFIASLGYKIASADYSQIELRIMAHLSQDEGLLRAFEQGLDVHRATASEVFGVTPEQVSSEQRRYAKVINFGLIYGMSAYGLANNLEIETSAAKSWIDRYFQRYPGVRRYMDETKQQAKERGYIETVFGRRLFLPEINSPNGPRRAAAERAAINAPMQGTAADLIKMAMVAMQNRLQQENKKTRMIMQVHDELVFEVPEEELEWIHTEVPLVMAGVAQLSVPLVAEIGVGINWDEAH